MADIQPISNRPPAVNEETKPVQVAVAQERPVAESPEDAPVVSSENPLGHDEIMDPATTREALESLTESLAESGPPGWQVAIHEDEQSGKMVVVLKDDKGETIKQFPPEKVLNLHRKLADLAGVVLDEAH